MFKITSHKGFQMTFENGWTVSVQFGPGNYCDRRDDDFNAPRNVSSGHWEGITAEIAAWNQADEWFRFGSDTVDGWQSSDSVARFIQFVSSIDGNDVSESSAFKSGPRE